jgi:hypothetical protein
MKVLWTLDGSLVCTGGKGIGMLVGFSRLELQLLLLSEFF